MECEVHIQYGDTELLIKKEDSVKQLSSVEDVAEYLINSGKNVKSLINVLMTTTKTFNIDLKFLDNKLLIGNTSLELFKYLYPKASEYLNKIPLEYLPKYILTRVVGAKLNGKSLRGRIVVNGEISYIIRDEHDAKQFAMTEYINYLVNRVVDGDTINDSYLNKKYFKSLTEIKDKLKKGIKTRISEIKDIDTVTILDLLNDYLYNKGSYDKDIKNADGNYLNTVSILNDFCLELLGQKIFSEPNETDIAKKLRTIDYRRQSFGKKEFFEALREFGNAELKDLLKGYPDGKLVAMGTSTLKELFLEYFKNDPIMSKYTLINAETTYKTTKPLTQKQIEGVIKKYNTKTGANIELETIKNEKDAADKIKFRSDLTITIDGVIYPVLFRTNKEGEFEFYYERKKLSNDEKITLKFEGKTLLEEFSFVGYDETFECFIPVNIPKEISEGYYKGWYIYEYKNPKNKLSTYIVSKHVIHPQLYNPKKYSTLEEAKLAIDGLFRNANIYKETNINFKKYVDNWKHEKEERVAEIPFRVSSGLVIKSRQYHIDPNTTLYREESDLINNYKYDQIQQFYLSEFGLNISKLKSLEDLGIFLYAMCELGMSIEKLRESNIDEIKPKVDGLIESILDTEVVNYLVESWEDLNANNYNTNKARIKVKVIRLPKDSINSSGTDMSGNPPKALINDVLFNIKNNLENSIFKGTDIKIQIISAEEALTLENSKKLRLFESKEAVTGVKGFVHNSNIYLIKENTELVDLAHETLHIVLGVLRVSDFKLYKEFLEAHKEKAKNYELSEFYHNFAALDRLEELVVRYLARELTNKSKFVNNFNDANSTYKTIISLFGNVNKTISRQIKECAESNTFEDGFKTKMDKLREKDTLDKISKQRILANIIKDNLGTNIFREGDDC